jgi:ribosomal protein L11 methyltransferase
MRWLAFHFATTHEAAELLTDTLTALGADGVQVQDAAEIRSILADPKNLSYADDDFYDQLDPVVRIVAYFALIPDGVRCNRDPDQARWTLYDNSEKHVVPLEQLEEQIRERLRAFAAYLDIGSGYEGCQVVREEDWAENWKQYYQTLHVTDRLVINPSWLDYQPAAGELVITLDPGSAFGTGTHETTALCARWLDEKLRPGDHVLDLGCGSGILAIIAARLGAGSVEAIDIDALAVSVAEANCRLNQVSVHVHAGEIKDAARTRYDLIVANIIADVIVAIMDQVPCLLAPGGLFIASGIIRDKLAAVEAAAAQSGLAILDQRMQNDWCALLLGRAKGDKPCTTSPL